MKTTITTQKAQVNLTGLTSLLSVLAANKIPDAEVMPPWPTFQVDRVLGGDPLTRQHICKAV